MHFQSVEGIVHFILFRWGMGSLKTIGYLECVYDSETFEKIPQIYINCRYKLYSEMLSMFHIRRRICITWKVGGPGPYAEDGEGIPSRSRIAKKLTKH